MVDAELAVAGCRCAAVMMEIGLQGRGGWVATWLRSQASATRYLGGSDGSYQASQSLPCQEHCIQCRAVVCVSLPVLASIVRC